MRVHLTFRALLFSLPILSILSVDAEEVLHRNRRVISNQWAEIGEFPSLASIEGTFYRREFGFLPMKYYSACGAVLFGDQWLITAATCFQPKFRGRHEYNNSPANWKVYMGSIRRKTDTLEKRVEDAMKKLLGLPVHNIPPFGVKKIIIHPLFNMQSDTSYNLHYNIALMKMEAIYLQYKSSRIGVVEIPDDVKNQSWPAEDSVCEMAGWGCSVPDGSLNKFARKVQLQILSHSQCFGRRHVENEICAWSYERGICSGDQGGPLICRKGNKKYLAGIASTAIDRNGRRDNIFMRATNFRKWIIDTITNNYNAP